MAQRQSGLRNALRSAGGVFLPPSYRRQQQEQAQREAKRTEEDRKRVVSNAIQSLFRRSVDEANAVRHDRPHTQHVSATKRPMAHRKHDRRRKNKAARLARRKNRVHS